MIIRRHRRFLGHWLVNVSRPTGHVSIAAADSKRNIGRQYSRHRLKYRRKPVEIQSPVSISMASVGRCMHSLLLLIVGATVILWLPELLPKVMAMMIGLLECRWQRRRGEHKASGC